MHPSIVSDPLSLYTNSDAMLDAHGLEPIWSEAVQALKASHEQQDIFFSRRLAHAMQRMSEQGIDEPGLAQIWQMSSRLVRRYLRYGRFLTMTGCPMSERTFWLYWTRVRDPSLLQDPAKVDTAYEQKVFRRIAELRDSGVPSLPHRRPRKPLPPERIAQTRRPLLILQRNLRRIITEDILPALNELRPLLHASRARWAPDQLARVSANLESGLNRLLAYLDKLGTSLEE